MTKIATPGAIEHLPFETYLSDCCDGPSLSSSDIRALVDPDSCPLKWWQTSALNPKRSPKKDSKATAIGRAVHALALGEPAFNANFVICPHDKLNEGDGYAWNKVWKKSVKDGVETRTLIRAADFDAVKAMVKSIRESPQVAGAFMRGKSEVSYFTRDDETGVWLKVRPDFTPEDLVAEPIQELKTAESIAPRRISRSAMEDYQYHIQGALQVDVVGKLMKCSPTVAHICIEKDEPYIAELRMFTPEQVDHGRLMIRRGLRIFKRGWDAWEAGKPPRVAWPGYTQTPQYFDTPYAIRKEMEELANGDHSDGNQGAPGTEAGNDDTDPGRFLRAG